MPIYTISPSSLTFDWGGCRRCFYIKQNYKVSYSGAFPGIFTTMSNLSTTFYVGKASHEISTSLPQGTVTHREANVKSRPIDILGTESQVVLRGRFDAAVSFTNGSYGIIDFKISSAALDEPSFYSPQLSAYAYALENPAEGALTLNPITRLGLFVLTPRDFQQRPEGQAAFLVKATWMDIPRDDAAFLALLGEVVSLLDQPAPPAPDEDCDLCNYRKKYKQAGFLE